MNLDFSVIGNQKNLLAFSAGVDSTALFFLLLEQNISFDIAIVNYNVRIQAMQEVAYARELALKYNKQIFIRDIKLENSSNFEKTARDIRYKFFEEIIDARAQEIGEIIAQTTQESLENEVGKTFEVYVDGESEEHEYLLSARKTLWAPDIDGEIYINDNELADGEQIKFGQIYTVKITELAGDKLLATVIK